MVVQFTIFLNMQPISLTVLLNSDSTTGLYSSCFSCSFISLVSPDIDPIFYMYLSSISFCLLLMSSLLIRLKVNLSSFSNALESNALPSTTTL